MSVTFNLILLTDCLVDGLSPEKSCLIVVTGVLTTPLQRSSAESIEQLVLVHLSICQGISGL